MAGLDLNASPAQRSVTDLDDVQALLRTGYGGLTEATFRLLRVRDAVAARAWLREAPVTVVADLRQRRSTALHVALTTPGLRALGVAEQAIAGFAPEFLGGMADAARARRLGDVGSSAPEHWEWGWGAREPHALLLLYAEPGALAAWRAAIETPAFVVGFEAIQELPVSDMKGREPFGFLDGISQPHLDWDGTRKPGSEADLEYGNLISAGEFVLGYPNEYGRYTDRPLLPADRPGASLLPTAQDDSNLRDLGRNGTYLVLRQLAQDVRGFWRFLAGQNSSFSMIALAEAMVGRRIDGDPLIASGARAIAGIGPDATEIARNAFTYDVDTEGLGCPFGAHVRRANPRTPDMPGGRQGPLGQLVTLLGFRKDDPRADVVAASRFHRILRRGREYGEFLAPEKAAEPDAPDPESGLNFIGLNANIARQFEFIQNAWVQSPHFAGLSGEADPLLGNRVPISNGTDTDAFSIPQPGGPCAFVRGLPIFVTVRGGAYFFLPGLRALRYFAGSG